VSAIELNGKLSKYYHIPTGIGQGSALGPLLFSLYINDMGIAINSSYTMYADDISMYQSNSCINKAIENLNLDLDSLYGWFQRHGLTVSLAKTKYMIFHNSHDTPIYIASIKVQGTEIERVFSFCYLGVVLDSSLTFEEHSKKVEIKLSVAISRLHCVKRLVPPNIIKILLSAYVFSIVDFCLIIWGVNTSVLLNLFRKVAWLLISIEYPSLYKKRKSVKRSVTITSTTMLLVLRKYDILPFHERRDLNIMRFILRSPTHPWCCGWFQFSKREVRMWPLMLAPSAFSQTFHRSLRYRGWKFWSSLPRMKSDFQTLSFSEKMFEIKNVLLCKRSDEFIYV